MVAFIDQATVDFINEKGGLKAIIISHPHFYTTHLEWARIFECPVYLAENDRQWVNREDVAGVRKWVPGMGTRDIEEVGGVAKAIVCGGHFDGSMVLLWEGKLFIADTIMSVPVSLFIWSLYWKGKGLMAMQSGFYHKDRLPGTVSYSFQWSYPNCKSRCTSLQG